MRINDEDDDNTEDDKKRIKSASRHCENNNNKYEMNRINNNNNNNSDSECEMSKNEQESDFKKLGKKNKNWKFNEIINESKFIDFPAKLLLCFSYRSNSKVILSLKTTSDVSLHYFFLNKPFPLATNLEIYFRNWLFKFK